MTSVSNRQLANASFHCQTIHAQKAIAAFSFFLDIQNFSKRNIDVGG